MQAYKNLILIGTSHIAIESVNTVKSLIEEKKPGIVAIELDRRRFFAIMQRNQKRIRIKDIKAMGIRAWVLNLIGAWAEKKLGKMVGVAPGSDMKTAAITARKMGANIALIDQDIELTLKKLIKRITLKEHWNFFIDIVKGLIFRKVEIEFDLRKVPSEKIVQKMVSRVKVRYPSVYKTLIEERNQVMAQNLYMLMTKFNDKQIIGIVGAGHEKSIIKQVKGLDKM